MFRNDWDRIGRDEMKAWQGSVLNKFIRTQVLPFSAFYKEVFQKAGLTADDIRSVDDLRKIPFTTKADIAPTLEAPGNPKRIILQPDPKTYSSDIDTGKKLGLFWQKIRSKRDVKELVLDEYLPVLIISTTGRTANPTPFVYTRRDLINFKAAAKRLFSIAGLDRRKDFIINIFPYAPHLAVWIVNEAGLQAGAQILHTGGGKVMGTDKIIRSIERQRATVLVGVPGYIYHILRLASERGCDYSNLRLIILGAERVTKGMKRRLKELCETMGSKNPAVISTYGFTEARTAWVECPCENSIDDTTGYHLYPDLEIFEIVDSKTGEPVKPGESGEVVYTSLDWRGSVVLRYKTGDYANGGIFYEPCPCCGSMAPRLTTNLTRLSDVSELKLAKVKGTLVNFNEFFPIFSSLKEIVEWQVEITKANDDPLELDEVHVHLAVTSYADQGQIVQSITNMMHERMEFTPAKVHFRSAEEMANRLGIDTRPKEMRIYDKRPELLKSEENS